MAVPPTSHFQRMKVAYLVLVLTLVPVFIAFYRVRTSLQARDRARFERITSEAESAIDGGVTRCVDQIYNMRALFAASPGVNWDEWQAYLKSMNVRQIELGIRSLGYIEKVTPETREDFFKRRHAETQIEFDITPKGERPVYYPAVYVTHFDSSAEVIFGLDHAVRPERLASINRAIDSNQPQMTDRVRFMHSTGLHTNSGIFIYLPVYRNNTSIGDAVQRRDAVSGLVYAAIIPEKLLSILFGGQANPEVDIEVFDGTKADPAQLLYDRDSILRAGNPEFQPVLVRKVTMPILNRDWTIFFSSTPGFDAGSQHYLQWLTLFGGLTVSLLLFAITWGQGESRARAEQDAAILQYSESALAAEKERLSVTLDSIADGVITTDAAGKIISINEAAVRLTGWPRHEAEGKPLPEIFRVVHEQTGEPLGSIVEKVLQTDAAVDLETDARLLTRDGTERAVADSAAPIHDKSGKIAGIVLVFRDVTERRKNEAELLKESKLETVGLLAGGIAHDFNNILTGIIGNISLARMSQHSTEKMMERLGGVERSALRAKDLTQQLLTFAKGGAPIRRWAQLPDLVKDVCQFAIQGSNVQCEYSLPPDTWPVELDEGQFRQALNHLIINAMQAMPDGGRTEVKLENVELTESFLAPLPAGNYVKLSIRDFGTGIQPEHLSRIFEPYFTTKTGGSGLGLATAYSVVRKHDGQIRVESTVNVGTVFHVYLPASQRAEVVPAPEMNQQEFFGHGRILVMDDEPEIVDIAGAMLRACGYEVETVKDGAEAIDRYLKAKAAGQPFDVVIMDLTVPNGMGGREAIFRLKQLAPEIKAIVSSGYSLDPVMANYRQYGFRGIIPKPYRLEELGRALREVLGEKKNDQPA